MHYYKKEWSIDDGREGPETKGLPAKRPSGRLSITWTDLGLLRYLGYLWARQSLGRDALTELRARGLRRACLRVSLGDAGVVGEGLDEGW